MRSMEQLTNNFFPEILMQLGISLAIIRFLTQSDHYNILHMPQLHSYTYHVMCKIVLQSLLIDVSKSKIKLGLYLILQCKTVS